jgi:hypothetical protein
MQEKIHQNDRVKTIDGRFLGTATSLHQRQDGINPKLELYATYLKTWNGQIGNWFFIPTDFIQHIDCDTGVVTLSVDFATVQQETWNRLPDFVARAHDAEIKLSSR